MMNITIRKYTSEDESALLRMSEGKYLEDYANYSRDKLTVAEYSGNAVGYCYISEGGDADSFYVLVYVSHEHRRRGIGTALYQAAEAQCQSAGCKQIYSNYYDQAVNEFVKHFNVSYTTSSDILKYSGSLLPEGEFNIRRYKDADYSRYHYLWSYEVHEMHKRIGLPVEEFKGIDDTNRSDYSENDTFILEAGGEIIGGGGISGDSIGHLAVDANASNRGYGTAIATFLTNEILRRGNKCAYLTCETGNANALHIYEKIGYKKQYTDYWAIKYM